MYARLSALVPAYLNVCLFSQLTCKAASYFSLSLGWMERRERDGVGLSISLGLSGCSSM